MTGIGKRKEEGVEEDREENKFRVRVEEEDREEEYRDRAVEEGRMEEETG